MKTNKSGIDIIKKWETLHDGDLTVIGLQPKLCPTGYWTVGYGHKVIDPETGKPASKKRAYELFPNLTVEDANRLLQEDLDIREAWFNKWLAVNAVNLNSNQFSALISFIYNVGTYNFSTSRMASKLMDNNIMGASNEFPRWKYGTVNGVKKVLAGLIARRIDEQSLFLT